MTDVFSKAKRSEIMSQVKGRGNKRTELALIKILREHRIIGWRRHQHVFGKPDFIFPRLKIALFVDGCFWHACPVHATQPRQNHAFWQKKLSSNKARDNKVNRSLRMQGWRVLRIWEHELAGKPPSCVRKLLRVLSPITPSLNESNTNNVKKQSPIKKLWR